MYYGQISQSERGVSYNTIARYGKREMNAWCMELLLGCSIHHICKTVSKKSAQAQHAARQISRISKTIRTTPPQAKRTDVPALCSAKRAPTRSECLRNLSVQFNTHCSCNVMNDVLSIKK